MYVCDVQGKEQAIRKRFGTMTNDLLELARYRARLQQKKSRNVNRLQKILEDANIKLRSVVSDIQGVSARAIIDALVADELGTAAMAKLAKGQLHTKIPQLLQALTGQVRPHHRFMLEEILGHLDHLKRLIAALSQQIQTLVA